MKTGTVFILSSCFYSVQLERCNTNMSGFFFPKNSKTESLTWKEDHPPPKKWLVNSINCSSSPSQWQTKTSDIQLWSFWLAQHEKELTTVARESDGPRRGGDQWMNLCLSPPTPHTWRYPPPCLSWRGCMWYGGEESVSPTDAHIWNTLVEANGLKVPNAQLYVK